MDLSICYYLKLLVAYHAIDSPSHNREYRVPWISPMLDFSLPAIWISKVLLNMTKVFSLVFLILHPKILMQKKHFRFIYCVEKLVVAHKYSEWESCFQKTGLESKGVLDCYKNGNGQKVHFQYFIDQIQKLKCVS